MALPRPPLALPTALFRSTPRLSTTVDGSTVLNLSLILSLSTTICATITLAGRALIISASLANGKTV